MGDLTGAIGSPRCAMIVVVPRITLPLPSVRLSHRCATNEQSTSAVYNLSRAIIEILCDYRSLGVGGVSVLGYFHLLCTQSQSAGLERISCSSLRAYRSVIQVSSLPRLPPEPSVSGAFSFPSYGGSASTCKCTAYRPRSIRRIAT